MPMPNDLYYTVLNHFQTILEPGTLHLHLAMPPSPNSQPLLPQAVFFNHVIINQTQFSASHCSVSYADAMIALRLNGELWLASLWTSLLSNKPPWGSIDWDMCIGSCRPRLILSIQSGMSSESTFSTSPSSTNVLPVHLFQCKSGRRIGSSKALSQDLLR